MLITIDNVAVEPHSIKPCFNEKMMYETSLQNKRHERVRVISPYIKNTPNVEAGIIVIHFDIAINKGHHVLTNHK